MSKYTMCRDSKELSQILGRLAEDFASDCHEVSSRVKTAKSLGLGHNILADALSETIIERLRQISGVASQYADQFENEVSE